MKHSPGVLAAIAITLALSACGAPENSVSSTPEVTATEAVEPQLYPAGPFELTSKSGAELSFLLPTAPDDVNLADIEQFRAETKAAPVTYLVIEVDNRNGSEPVLLENVSAIGEDGTKYEFTSVSAFLGEWSPYFSEDYEYVLPDGTTLPEAEGTELYDRGVDIYNAHLSEVAVAEKATVILASLSVDLPSEFTRVVVNLDALATEGEEATPSGS